MGRLLEEDLNLRAKINKVFENDSFIAFLSLFDFISSLCFKGERMILFPVLFYPEFSFSSPSPPLYTPATHPDNIGFL